MCFDKEFHKNLVANNEMGPLEFENDEKRCRRFWLDMKFKNSMSKNKKEKEESTRGRIKVQIDVLTAEQADANPVGKAR